MCGAIYCCKLMGTKGIFLIPIPILPNVTYSHGGRARKTSKVSCHGGDQLEVYPPMRHWEILIFGEVEVAGDLGWEWNFSRRSQEVLQR